MRFLLLLALVGFLTPFRPSSAQDWVGLRRFEEDNRMIGPPAADEARVVFMGDSITEGWAELMPEFFAGRPYVNRGISGQTTPQMLVRFRADVIDLEPKVVVILAGTNDIAGNTGPATLPEIAGNIASMAELARAHGIRVVISSVVPAADYPWSPGLGPDRKIPALNGLLRAYADAQGFEYLDYFGAMTDGRNGLPPVLSEDGVHPNRAGYEVMAPLAEEAIRTAIGQ